MKTVRLLRLQSAPCIIRTKSESKISVVKYNVVSTEEVAGCKQHKTSAFTNSWFSLSSVY